MIVPAGRNMPEWSPKGTKLQKLASDGQDVQDQEVDSLYEAAKGFADAEKTGAPEDASCCEEVATDEDAIVIEVEDEAVEEVGEAVKEVSDDMDAPQSVSEAVAEVEVKAEEAEAKVEAVEEALEMIEEAVQGVRDVAGTAEKVEEAIEVEVEDDVDTDEIPGEEVVDSEVIVEGDGPECEAKDKTGMDKSAAAEEFCRFAKLSPQNRKKLANYWTNMLGYPRDYVSLMTKDYEK